MALPRLQIVISNEMNDWKSISLIDPGNFNQSILAFSSKFSLLEIFSWNYPIASPIYVNDLFASFSRLCRISIMFMSWMMLFISNCMHMDQDRMLIWVAKVSYVIQFLPLQAELQVRDILKRGAYHTIMANKEIILEATTTTMTAFRTYYVFALFLHPITMCTSLQHWECV